MSPKIHKICFFSTDIGRWILKQTKNEIIFFHTALFGLFWPEIPFLVKSSPENFKKMTSPINFFSHKLYIINHQNILNLCGICTKIGLVSAKP